MIRIYADFNTRDVEGRAVLNTVGSLEDVNKHQGELVAGMRVLLYEDELEIEGTLVFDRVWRAVPDWTTLRYLDDI